MEKLLEEMGYEHTKTSTEGGRRRYESDGELGNVVDALEDPQAPSTTSLSVLQRMNHRDWCDAFEEHGLSPTGVIDRRWFSSVRARTHGGVLFELATEEPGYTVDEETDSPFCDKIRMSTHYRDESDFAIPRSELCLEKAEPNTGQENPN